MPGCGLTRREFLKRSAGAGAAAALGGPLWLAGCRPAGAGVDWLAPPVAGPAVVAAARGRDLAAMTRQALARLGGIEAIVRPGESVFIKPNLLTAGLRRADYTGTGETAKPEIVAALAEECLRAGAREVTIGDGAQVVAFDWADLRTLDGRTHLAAEAERLNTAYDGRLRLACLNRDSPGWEPLPSPRTSLGQVYVSSLVHRADRIISVPVMKTHRLARLSLSIKNFMGVTPIARYGGGSEIVGRFTLHATRGGLEAVILDLLAGLRPDLAVIDASIGCEGEGPWVRAGAGRRVDLRDRLGDWLVLASTDPVAADATAARVIGHDPAAVPHLARAHAEGLGQAEAGLIELVGATLDGLRMEWEPAPGR